MSNHFQVMPVVARNLSDVCIAFGRSCVGEKIFFVYVHVVEHVYFEALCCNLYNSRLDAFDFGGSYVIMQI